MNNRVKPISLSKKIQGTNSMKEIVKQNQFTNELLRICISRAEELAIIKAISERKSGKLRMQIKLAEKTLLEAEYKEEWRLTKEDSILAMLAFTKFEAQPSKKQLEKISRKMMRINMQFEDDITESEKNLSEIHVNSLMNTKICAENTYFSYDDNGETLVTVPQGNINVISLKEQYSKVMKILESCLYGDNINVYNLFSHCVNYGRQIFDCEVKRQKITIEQGMTGTVPLSVFITSKSNSNLNNTKKMLSPIRKQPQLPECNWTNSMFKMMMDQNAEISKGIKNFISEYNLRHSSGSLSKDFDSQEDKSIYKAQRAKTYEERPPVNPGKCETYPSIIISSRNRSKQSKNLFMTCHQYFEESSTLEQRINLIHSCILIQRSFRNYKERVYTSAIIIIQKNVRMFLTKKKLFLEKISKFRRIYFWERLKHWYPLLVNKIRERKSQRPLKDYSPYAYHILTIQRISRGYIERKLKLPWKIRFKFLLDRKINFINYTRKQAMWRSCFKDEEELFSSTQNINESMNPYKAQLDDRTNKKDEKELIEVIHNFEKTKMESRKRSLMKARSKRIMLID
ncbi:unnamed protein product [Blepharisma stoltei]|uniref:Uncharacterized protein n=1 Tax=Blepharisma stoltei TaxID=1481888 RepID=A0AAU9KQA0_9CILI|nr:unnamed protein product [Blepharisma stoltei]